MEGRTFAAPAESQERLQTRGWASWGATSDRDVGGRVNARRAALLLAATMAFAWVAASPAAQEETITLAPAADTYVKMDEPSANFGTADRFSAQGHPQFARQALLRFKPVTVPGDRQITSAKLRLWVEGGTATSGGVSLYETTGAWDESGVTWLSQPARGPLLGTRVNLRADTWVEWDVTKAVPATGTAEVNFMLSTSDPGWYGFETADKATANGPKLVLVTRAAPAQGADTTPPDTTITAGPSGSTRSAAPSFSFTATESLATFECRLDGQPFVPCTSPKQYTDLPTGSHEFSVRATDAAANRDESPASRQWTVTPPGRDVVIAAVGDMNPPRTRDATSPSARNGAAIAEALRTGRVDAFFGLGDFQYDVAYCADYVNYWRSLWGGTKRGLYWISAPNHDWQPGRNEDLDNFMNGECPGDAAKAKANQDLGRIENGTPYSVDFGSWHVAFLSSALWVYDVPRAETVTTWLDQDLAAAAAAGRHLAVLYHEPYFTSDTSHHTRAAAEKPWIDVMWKHRVRLTLSGSQHNYERSCPVDNTDHCVADGMTAFQVSTGGIGLREFLSSPPYIVKRFTGTHGWLELSLHGDGSFDWQFNPVSGAGTDSGSRPAQ
jgi:hypothetical protein